MDRHSLRRRGRGAAGEPRGAEMGTKDPINIQRFVRQNERYSLAAAYSDQ